jgi:hypothetical protein
MLSFGSVGGQRAEATGAGREQVDISLLESAFVELQDLLMPRTAPLPRESEAALATYALVLCPGVGRAFAQMTPWFLTMGLVGVLGALSEPLLRTMAGSIVLFGAIFPILGGGIYYTIRRANRPKAEVLLRLSKSTLALGEPPHLPFEARLPDLRQRFETYLYATKYGSYRFPVLVLGDGVRELRVGVWEEHGTVGVPIAPLGAAPQYLVSAAEFRDLVARLRR